MQVLTSDLFKYAIEEANKLQIKTLKEKLIEFEEEITRLKAHGGTQEKINTYIFLYNVYSYVLDDKECSKKRI